MSEIRPLTETLTKIAKDQLNETPDHIQSGLQALKDWLLKSPHLNCCKDEQFLLAFLRGCKYSLEKAKRKLDAYYTMQTEIPEVFEYCDPMHPKVRNLLKNGSILPLTVPFEDDSPIIYLSRTGNYDTYEYGFINFLAMGIMNTKVLLTSNDQYVVCGQIVIHDLQDQTMKHMLQSTPFELKRLIDFHREALPIRQKEIHFINAPSIHKTFCKTFKAMMPQKFQDKIKIHDSLEDLHKFVPKKALPQEYGGDNGPISELITSWENQVMAQRYRLLAEKNYGVDESKRPYKSTSFDGIDGSFRKLTLD